MPAVNRKAPDATHTQSVLFSKANWTKQRARKWLADHDFITRGLDETENTLRYRQYDPDSDRFRYRTKTENLPAGITFVIGFKQGSRP
jgi:hypothetical protein